VLPAAVVLALIAPLAAALGAGTAVPLPPRPHLRAERTATPPKIDGHLDDPVWRAATPSDAFTQHFPDEGEPPSERTEVRVLYDDHNIYFGIDCEQRFSPVVRRLMRRDGQLPSDGVVVDIDSRRSGVSAFHFAVNAAGVLSDAIHFNDTDYSSDWDAVWEAKVADTGHGYSMEIRIPLSVMRFSAAPVQDWGLQVRRFIDARQEWDDWAFYPRSAATYVPLFGRLDNLVGLEPRHHLELLPFVLGKLEHRAPDVGTVAHGFSADWSAGLDAKAHVTNELTLDLTIKPDFGQVEADQVILNLSTFETFFPEKRPFFLEGIDAFAAMRQVLYTRRIGRQPALPSLSGTQSLVENAEPAPIYAAAKLVGTVGGRTTLGIISALTGESAVDVQDTATGAPPRTHHVLEPLSTYNVVRVKRLLGANSDVGILATATNRFESLPPPGALCPVSGAAPGPDGRCTNDAYVLSADGRWRSSSGDYGVSWQALASTLRSGPDRSEPDGIPIHPGTTSGGASLYVGKDGGAHWLWSATQYLAGRQLELNDVGYLERKNDYQLYTAVVYRTLNPWWTTLESRTTLAFNLRETLDGIDLWRETVLANTANLTSFWSTYFDVHVRFPYYDDREMGDGSALERPANVGVVASLASDPRRRIMGYVAAGFDHKTTVDGIHFDARGDFTVRVLPQLELELQPTVSYDSGTPRYLSTDAVGPDNLRLYHFGAQNAVSTGATLRASYAFTPELSLQIYNQIFFARVRYGPLYTAPSLAFRQRVALDTLVRDPAPSVSTSDSETATLNVNVVLRWEYHLGSTAFLVYTRAQNPALTPAPGGAQLEIAPLLQGHAADNVVMLKLAYWWG
jgi:hypothetical protein